MSASSDVSHADRAGASLTGEDASLARPVDARHLASSPIVEVLLRAAQGLLLLLDERLGIVAANEACLSVARVAAAKALLGLTPGEALGCVHARGAAKGCGSTEPCAGCGLLEALDASRRDRRAVEHEWLLRAGDESPICLELEARVAPLEVEGVPLLAVALRDLGDRKRREALEEVFFHDLFNTAAALTGWSERLPRIADQGRWPAVAGRIAGLSRRLVRQIEEQRALRLAETGALKPALRSVVGFAVLDGLRATLASPLAASGCRLEIEDRAPGLSFLTDPALLEQILRHMLTNAIEATAPGGLARAWVERQSEEVVFAVHDEAVMPPEVCARIFHRSFSTKSRTGRGLGTYSMKLLGERFLGGHVSFESRSGEGTVFSLRLPLDGASRG